MSRPTNIARGVAAVFGFAALVAPWKMEACGTVAKHVSLYQPLDDIFTPDTNEDDATGMCVLGILVLQATSHLDFTRQSKRTIILLLLIGWGTLTTGIHGLMSPKCPGAQLQGGPFMAYFSVAATSYSLWMSYRNATRRSAVSSQPNDLVLNPAFDATKSD